MYVNDDMSLHSLRVSKNSRNSPSTTPHLDALSASFPVLLSIEKLLVSVEKIKLLLIYTESMNDALSFIASACVLGRMAPPLRMTFSSAFFALALLAAPFTHASGSQDNEPYIIRSGSDTFALCSGAAPSEKLRTSLLMCRDLSYPFCVNSTTLSSILRLEPHVTRKFTDALAEPTYEAIENLAWLVDSSLVVLYDAFAAQANAEVRCAYEWHAWICSRVFARAHLDDAKLSEAERRAVIKSVRPLPVGVCEHVCRRTERACVADLQCAAESAQQQKPCTDYYNDSAVCASHETPVRKTPAPVFAQREWERRHRYRGSKRSSRSSAHSTHTQSRLWTLAAALFILSYSLVCP